MKLYFKKINKNNLEQYELREGKISLNRNKFNVLIPINVGDIVIFFVSRTNRCYFSVLENSNLILKFKVIEEVFFPDLISVEKNTTLLFDSEGHNDVTLLQNYYTMYADIFHSASVKTILCDLNEIVLGNEDKLSCESIKILFDPNYHKSEVDTITEKAVSARVNNMNDEQDNIIKTEISAINHNVKDSNILNIKCDKFEGNIKNKTIVYFVFLFNKIVSFDSGGFINRYFEKFVSCNQSSLVYWFDELYIYVSRKERDGHEIYYKILRSNISPNYSKLIRSLSVGNNSFLQFSTDSYFLYEYIMSRKEANFSNLKEEILLNELFKIIKKYLTDNNISITQSVIEQESNSLAPENELSIFEAPAIRDVYCYLLGKGFNKISVLNSIRELSPNDYYSAIKKNDKLLLLDTSYVNEAEITKINYELNILITEFNGIKEIDNPMMLLSDEIQLHISSIKENLNIPVDEIFNKIIKVIYPLEYTNSIKKYNEIHSRKNEILKLISDLNSKLEKLSIKDSEVTGEDLLKKEKTVKYPKDVPFIHNSGYKLSFLEAKYYNCQTNTYLLLKSAIYIFVNPNDIEDFFHELRNNTFIIKGQGVSGNQHFGSNINTQVLNHKKNDIPVYLFKKNNNTTDCLFVDQINYVSHSFEEEINNNKSRSVIKYVFKSISSKK